MESLAKIKQDILTAYDNYKKEHNGEEPFSARFHAIWREDPAQTLDPAARVCIGDAIEFIINNTNYCYFVTGITELIELVEKNNTDEMESCEFVKFAEFE